MTHTSRATAAAMLATARPEPATDEVITDLAERLNQAIETIQFLADAPRAPGESNTALTARMLRLHGKVQGLKVALSYVQEIQRAALNRACPSQSSGHPDDALPCLLPDGHDGWHKGLGATWSGGTTYPAVPAPLPMPMPSMADEEATS